MTKSHAPTQPAATRGRWLSVACVAGFVFAACKPQQSKSTGGVDVQRGPAPATSGREVSTSQRP